MAEIGQILNGRYRVLEALSMGGTGLTYIAEDISLPEKPKCAIEQLQPSAKGPNSISGLRIRFKREIEALRQLRDRDRIPQLLEDFEQQAEFYLVSEYVEGHPLTVEMPLGKHWNEVQTIQILKEVLSILKVAHNQGAVHGNIRPDNIVRRHGDGALVLTGFGVVRQASVHSGVGVVGANSVSTLGYSAIGQAQPRPELNTDIHALGIVGIQALTGIAPTQFQEDDQTGQIVWQHYVPVSAELAAVLSKMVKKHFRERYQSAAEVLLDLARISAKQETTIGMLGIAQYQQIPNYVPQSLRLPSNASSSELNYPSRQPDTPTVPLSNAVIEFNNPNAARPAEESTLANPPCPASPVNVLPSGNPAPVPLFAQSPPLPPQPTMLSANSRRSRAKAMAIAAGFIAIAAAGTVFGLKAIGLVNPSITKLVDAGGDKRLTVGIITTRGLSGDTTKGSSRDGYAAWLGYIKTELGSDVQYELAEVSLRNGQKAIDEVKQKINNKEWDVAFTFLPTLSITAQDNGYVFAAKMFPERKESPAVFFVRADSPIYKFDDIVDNPNFKIALGNFDSPQSFYVPLYHLYGTALQASYGNSPREILAKVRSGRADIGVGRLDSILRRSSSNSTDASDERQGESQSASQKNEETLSARASSNAALNNLSNSTSGEQQVKTAALRIIKPKNEDIPIPLAGVYISPKISLAERTSIVETMFRAPLTIQKDAHYDRGDEPNYKTFRRVANRVNDILKCADYRSGKQIDANEFYPAHFYKRNGCS